MAVRERAVESVQDRMLRDADRVFFSDPMRTCGECGEFTVCRYRDVLGGERCGALGRCGQLDLVCDAEAPACEWWSA